VEPQYDVVGVKPKQELKVLLLGDEMLGLDHHWVIDEAHPKGRSRLCTYQEGYCKIHADGRLVWLGYIAALEMVRKTRVVLRVGAETAKAMLTVLGRSVTMRGAHLLLNAVTDGGTSRACVEVLHEVSDTAVPKAHRIDKTICNLLGVLRLPDYGPTAADAVERLKAEEVPF
jgi:hypothetical protein